MQTTSGGHCTNNTTTLPKFVYLYSNPLTYGDTEENFLHLDLSQEIKAIHDALTDSGKQVEWMQSRAVKDRLCDVTTLGCTLIHWAGHGHANALMAEDEWGRLNQLSPEILQQMCQRGVTVAIITSCFSEFAGHAFVNAGIPHVVAVRSTMKVSSHACKKFTYGFYLALLSNHTVSEAFEIGKSKVRASYVASEADGFVLLPETQSSATFVKKTVPAFDIEHFMSIAANPRELLPWEVQPAASKKHNSSKDNVSVSTSDHNVCCLGSLKDGQWQNVSYSVPHMHPFPPTVLVPRKKYIFKVVEQFCSNHRMVMLTGPSGVGKYTLAQTTCDWLKWESIFPDGIYWIDCACEEFQNLTKSKSFINSKERISENCGGEESMNMPNHEKFLIVHKIIRNGIPILSATHKRTQHHHHHQQQQELFSLSISKPPHARQSTSDQVTSFQREVRACSELNFLIVLARWQALPKVLEPMMKNVIQQFMDNTRNVKFLVTHQSSASPSIVGKTNYVDGADAANIAIDTSKNNMPSSLPYKTVKTVVVDALTATESATLLYKLYPFTITMKEIMASDLYKNDAGQSTPVTSTSTSVEKISALARHRIVQLLRGNPRELVNFTRQLSNGCLFANLVHHYESKNKVILSLPKSDTDLTNKCGQSISTDVGDVQSSIVSKSILKKIYDFLSDFNEQQGSTLDKKAHEHIKELLESQLQSLHSDSNSQTYKSGKTARLDYSDWCKILRLLTEPVNASWVLFWQEWQSKLAKPWFAICEIRRTLHTYCQNKDQLMDWTNRYFFSKGKRLVKKLCSCDNGTFAFRRSNSTYGAVVLMWVQRELESTIAGEDQGQQYPHHQPQENAQKIIHQIQIRFVDGFTRAVDVAKRNGTTKKYRCLLYFLQEQECLNSPLSRV